MPCLFPFLPFLICDLLSHSVLKRWLSGTSHLKRQQGPAAVAVVNLSWYLMYTGTGICPWKLSVPCKSPSADWLTFRGLLLDFPERQWGSRWIPELLLRLGIVPQLIGFLLFSWVDFLRGESFWSLSYPVLLQPESQASLSQDAHPQAG